MPEPNYFLFYVDSPAESAAFYSDLLGKAPVASSPTFALFALQAGTMLGFWSRHTVEPAAAATGGGGEIGFHVKSVEAVEALYGDWSRRGLRILQEPVLLDFGFTFVALDPDGHRLRVFAPGKD